jgi:hypothetical protein
VGLRALAFAGWHFRAGIVAAPTPRTRPIPIGTRCFPAVATPVLPAGRGGNRRWQGTGLGPGRLDSIESYNPASYRGGILRLHYARARELGPWLDRVAVRGEVIVQFWLKPGEAAVTLGVGEEREVEKIPEQLRRFL